MTVEPTELTVDPGREVTTTVTVRNLGTRVEEFRLTPGGPAAGFASIAPTTLSVYPSDEQRAVVRFAPVREPQSVAGVAPFEIMASSTIHADVIDVGRGQVTVAPFEELRAVLRPEVSRGRTPSRHQVSVTNDGNTPVNAQLAFRDQAGELTFEPPSGAATLQPGAGLSFPVKINGPYRWFGRTTRLPFSAVVTPAGPQPPIMLHGTRQQTAVFPWWIPTAAVAVVAVAIALFAVWPKPSTPRVPVIGLVDQATAVQQLTAAQYVPEVIPAGDDIVATGLAIRTDPAGGMELPHSGHVKLYISTGKCPEGPCPVEVPNVEGLSVSQAQSMLQDRKFAVRSFSVSSDRPADQVIASDPKPATLRPPGSEVVLTVSSGPQGSSPSPGPPSSGPPSPPPQYPRQILQVPPLPNDPRPLTPAPRTPTPPSPTPPPPEKCSPTPSNRPADGLTVKSPGSGDTLRADNEARGTANLKSSEKLWLLLCAPKVEADVGGGVGGFYIESGGPVSVSGGTWTQKFGLDTRYHGDYILYAVIVNAGQDPYEFVVHDGNGNRFGRQLPQNAYYVHVSVKCCS